MTVATARATTPGVAVGAGAVGVDVAAAGDAAGGGAVRDGGGGVGCGDGDAAMRGVPRRRGEGVAARVRRARVTRLAGVAVRRAASFAGVVTAGSRATPGASSAGPPGHAWNPSSAEASSHSAPAAASSEPAAQSEGRSPRIRHSFAPESGASSRTSVYPAERHQGTKPWSKRSRSRIWYASTRTCADARASMTTSAWKLRKPSLKSW